MLKKRMKTSITLAVAVAVCMSLPYAAWAAIGAEPSNATANPTYSTAAEPTYSAAPAVANIPPYPGMDNSGTYITSVQPGTQYYQDIPQYLYQQQGTVPNYGTVPGTTSYGTPYAPYDTMSNMTYPGYSDMAGTMPYGMPYAPYGGMYPMQPTGGDALQYSMPSTGYPYDPYQQYGQMYPQQGQGYYQQYGYETADQAYNQAKQAFDSKDYWTAMTKFQEVATRFPQSDLVDNAYYWTGEIYYAWKNFPAAIQSFQTVLYSYPQGNKVPDAHVKIGFAYAEMRQYSMAKSTLNDVVSRYQNNARIRGLALKKLNELNNQY